MSECISVVIYYDVDPVTYDSFDIKGTRSLEAMLQTHLASGSPYLQLYVQFSSPNDAFRASTFTADNKSDADPPRKAGPDGAEVALFFQSEPVPTIPEMLKGVQMMKKKIHDSGRVLEDHPKMNSYMLATLILPTVKTDPRTSVLVLIANIRSQLKYTPSYRKAWIAKQKALEKIHDGWDASYNEVWQWCQVLERYVPGYVTDLETEPTYTYWLLLAVTRDDSGRILPLAFAITQGESADDWEFFLYSLRRHVCPQPNIYVISDRGTGILPVIEQQGRYEISKDSFYEMLAVLHSVNEEGADYLCNIPFEQWTQAYNGGLQYGQITSNLAECINSVLKRTRHLSITSVVRQIYFRLAELFWKRAVSYKGQMQGGCAWCAKVLQEINKAKARGNTMYTVCHD
ncbi:hypothetical protein PVK06_048030 [Gossypium arboreum]|uniref:MULE transposase domain-containing protein n=1 Tax=Gossypium arboreum TaxID=29729 RepID=A0ABR0MFA9_GOSAR|nr:hypothetical protein PVK06_048030 [Gossypium arboreum]